MHVTRRVLTKLTGCVALVGVLAAAGCAPSEQVTESEQSTLSSVSVGQRPSNLPAGDMSTGADNFYTSDTVTVRRSPSRTSTT